MMKLAQLWITVSCLCVACCMAEAPEHETADAAHIGALFDAGRYQEAIDLAQAEYLNGDKEVSLYVASAASCMLGEYRQACIFGSKYFEEFPQGQFQKEVGYYYGVSMARLGYKDRAEKMLSQLVDKAEGRFRTLSLYELALMSYASADYAAAEQYVQSLLSAAEGSGKVEVQGLLLRAKIMERTMQRDVAEGLYLKAYEIAEQLNDEEMVAESLFCLVAYYGREKIQGEKNLTVEKALPYYDNYMVDYAGQKYTAQVIAAAIPALEAAGRLGEVTTVLEAVIKASIESDHEAGIQRAAGEYLWARIQQGETLSEIRQELLNDQKHGARYLAVLHLALSEIYAIGAKQSQISWGKALKMDVLSRASLAKVAQLEKQEATPAYVHAALGEYYLKSPDGARSAEEHFQRALETPILANKDAALFGLSKALTEQGGVFAEDALSLLLDLEQRNQGNADILDITVIEIMRCLEELERWEELSQRAEDYVNTIKSGNQRVQVHYWLAKSYDKLGKEEEAIANYSQIFISATGNLPISAPTVDRLTELTWARNKPKSQTEPSDRQIAYQLAHRYLSLIEDSPEWLKERADVKPSLESIRAHVAEWEGSGEVQSVAEILEEMRRGERPVQR